MNTYSKYWYEDNNLEQYAVEGILQVGDENGLILANLDMEKLSPTPLSKSEDRHPPKEYKRIIKLN